MSISKNKTDFKIPYAKELNPSQFEAVTTTEGSLLIIAGAGSGKTRTLTYRVARLVELGVAPGAILLLTFTRKASMEMLQRASNLLDNRCARVSGGTFHSFANSILRRYPQEAGFESGFTIIDRTDSESLIGMLRKENKLVSKFHSFPRKKTLADIFGKVVNKVLSIEEVVNNDYPHFCTGIEEINNLHKEYNIRKIKHNFLDYDDLLTYLNRLLSNDHEICEKIASNYHYIMVDEYQDTNKIQASILYLLAESRKNIMVVGDDSQCIYAFRGANFKNIMTFPKKFPETKIIKLEENYRSVQPILNLTNHIIERAADKYTKSLFTRRKGGILPVLTSTKDENTQSLFIVKTIKELYQKGTPLNQIAILFRAGFHSFDLEVELSKAKIPFIKVGGFKFMETAHIKDIIAHLKVIHNPNDRVSWHRILLLLDKIGPKTADNIFNLIMEKDAGIAGFNFISPKPGIENRITGLKNLFTQICSSRKTIAMMGEMIIKYYTPVLEKKYDNYPKRAKDLEHLAGIMERYDNLETFLADMSLEPPNTSMDDTFTADYSGNERLVLSTIHSAKGLEWHTVFIIWTLDGRFPSLHALNNPESLEEERRLMYVASTRAKEKLFFVHPTYIYDRSSSMILNDPSCFIDVLPETILEKNRIGLRY